MVRLSRPALAALVLGLGALAPAAARAACIGAGGGDLAELERLGFNEPRVAARRAGELLGDEAAVRDRLRRATLQAILAEAQRQGGRYPEAVAAATRGLAELGDAGPADLQLRLGIAQALAWHADHQTARGLERLDTLLAAQPPGSLGEACVRKDRGWLRFSEGDTEGALRDLIPAYEQLRTHRLPEEQAIVAGRLATVYVGAREFEQATDLLDETIAYFTETRAQARLPTAFDRLGRVYSAQGRWSDALDAFEKMRGAAERIGDGAAMAYARVRLCGVEIEEGAWEAAARHCTAAREAMARASAADREEQAILTAYQARIDLAAGNAAAALAGFDRALEADPAALSRTMRSQFHRWRAGANAATGRYQAAYADLQEYLSRMQAIDALETARQIAVLRVRFATDREVRRNELLLRDNALKQERLARSQIVSRLWTAVAISAVALLAVLAVGLRKDRRHRVQLQSLAELDDLTRVPNRRRILELAAAAFVEARERRRPLALALLDVDHFKAINDTYGHATGDEVLQRLARRALELLGDRGSIGRYGGEEFLVVLPGSGLEGARPVLDALLEAAKQLPLPPELAGLRVTLSAGVATLQVDDASVEAMVRRADAALYTAKNAGRDRVSAIVA
ncbi:MAG: GGDEF domain-containing protein [Steroidobacteraceae bacterium]|nr:GGDEF domain-containing protein [Steroidobacteraceae bacterium]